MDPAEALADLTRISTQVRDAVVFAPDAAVIGSTIADEARAEVFAKAASRLLDAADRLRPDGEPIVQLEAALEDASVAIVRTGEHAIAATTDPEPTIGLVFYDLRTCLRDVAEEPKPKPKPRRRAPARKKKAEGDAAS